MRQPFRYSLASLSLVPLLLALIACGGGASNDIDSEAAIKINSTAASSAAVVVSGN
jgi:hypothetical protein